MLLMTTQEIIHDINRILIDKAPTVFNIWDEDRNMVYSSKQVVELFGFETAEEYISQFHRLSPEFQPCGTRSMDLVDRQLTAAFREGSASFEWLHKDLEGRPLPCSIQLERVAYKGRCYLVAYLQDQREYYKLINEIERTKKLHETLLNEAPFFIEIWNRDLEIVELNPEAFKMFGHLPSEVPSLYELFLMNSPELQPCGTPSRVKIKQLIEESFAVGRLETDWLHVNAVGDQFPCQVTYVRVLLEDSEVVVGYNVDLRDSLARKAAENAVKAKGNFLSTVSHEIRTPLNAVLGITDIQLMRMDLPQDIRDAFERIYTSSDLLLNLINDILDNSKIESGLLDILPKEYDVASFIVDTVQLNLAKLKRDTVMFKLEVDPDLPSHFIGDELRLKQVLNNVLSNAFKYTEAGSVELTIGLDYLADDERPQLMMTVRDTGYGMSEAQLAQLFDSFSRFHEQTNQSIEGTGLGMSITQTLLKLMEGDILVESCQDVGTTVKIRVPQQPTKSFPIGVESVENLQYFSTTKHGRQTKASFVRTPMPYGKVLIVDDIETNLFVANGLIAPYQIKIETVTSGRAAINKIKEGQVYDIIFMDHMMPEIDGIEATKQIRATGYTAPIVALTANALASNQSFLLANDFTDFMPKPIDVRELNKILNTYIRDVYPEQAKLINASLATLEVADSEENEIPQPLAELFIRDASKSLAVFLACPTITEDNIDLYRIHVHGMKSSFNNLKQVELAALAEELENLAHDLALEDLNAQSPSFVQALSSFLVQLKTKYPVEVNHATQDDRDYLQTQFTALREGCEDYDELICEAAIQALQAKSWTPGTLAVVNQLAQLLLLGDFEAMLTLIEQWD